MDDIFSSFFSLFSKFRWIDILDIVLVYIIIYLSMLFIKGTRAVQILTGLGVLAVVYFIAEMVKLYTLHFLLNEFFNNLFLIVIILFHIPFK